MAKKLSLIALLSFALFAFGCSTKKTTTDVDPNQLAQTKVENVAQDIEAAIGNMDSDSGTAGDIKSINFDFNSAQLSNKAKSILDNNAKYLKLNLPMKIQIEGHCDERGSVQYNLALGEQRAKAVKNYLIALGVNGDRLSTISFGKERPVSFNHDEDSWGKNRRANFVVTAK